MLFELSKGILKDKVTFILVENPVHTLSLMKSCLISYVKSAQVRQNVLEILLNKRIFNNIQERLTKYWKGMRLPYEWIPEILKILSNYNYNEDLAINKIRSRFPSLTHKDSLYFKELAGFRSQKVINLSRRINRYIQGEVIADIGGRSDDFVEQILLRNKLVKMAYVTDIGTFSERSDNPKIDFVVQPSLTKTPFQKESINAIILSLILHHMKSDDQENFVKHLISLLKKKGKIILIEDSYPEIYTSKRLSETMKDFLRFNSEEKKKILSFYDWFGNRLMRNRDNIALTFNYKTMEEWKKLFEQFGLIQIKSDFIKENLSNLDLFPPKALIIFQKK